MRILALDFGLKTGWASHNRGIGVVSNAMELGALRGESPGARWLRFSRWLESILSLTMPNLVVYEQAHHRGGYATDILVGMVTRLHEKCELFKVEYAPVHSATLKKWATGNGRADKEDMVLAAVQRYPNIAIKDDNQADALLLLAYAEEKFGAVAEIRAS